MGMIKLNCLLICTFVSLNVQAFQLDSDLTVTNDNNVSVAESNQDIFNDTALDLSLMASQSFRLNPHGSLSVKGKLERIEFARFNDLSNTTLALGAVYRIQPVIGFFQPWFSLTLNAEKLLYDHSDIRDGSRFNVSTAVHQRLTERLSANLGAAYEKRVADEADVFAWKRYSVFLAGNYQLSEQTTLFGSYAYQIGDQVFVATPSPAFKTIAHAIADDPIFGERRAYRLDAKAKTLNMGVDYRISANNKLNIGLQYALIQAEASHEYDATQLHISWLHRY